MTVIKIARISNGTRNIKIRAQSGVLLLGILNQQFTEKAKPFKGNILIFQNDLLDSNKKKHLFLFICYFYCL